MVHRIGRIAFRGALLATLVFGLPASVYANSAGIEVWSANTAVTFPNSTEPDKMSGTTFAVTAELASPSGFTLSLRHFPTRHMTYTQGSTEARTETTRTVTLLGYRFPVGLPAVAVTPKIGYFTSETTFVWPAGNNQSKTWSVNSGGFVYGLSASYDGLRDFSLQAAVLGVCVPA